jgi:DTW domain-containing protein YfiP
MHASLCVCALIPRVPTRTRLVLIIHRFEARKTTNTGRLAAECLPNSEVLVRGHAATAGDDFLPDPATQPVLLFPHEDAVPVATFSTSPRPVTLIVPDGTWRQASKVRSRVPGLRDVPCVSLTADAPSTYRLRSEAHEHGLATIEAIARALGVLEGTAGAAVRRQLEGVFRAMVERTLWARGALDAAQVEAGIPQGAMRHDPHSGVVAAARRMASG